MGLKVVFPWSDVGLKVTFWRMIHPLQVHLFCELATKVAVGHWHELCWVRKVQMSTFEPNYINYGILGAIPSTQKLSPLLGIRFTPDLGVKVKQVP